MPYKHRADFDFDTFFPYELNVFANMDVEAMKKAGIEREIPELIQLLSGVHPLDPAYVPRDSLIREFIGGGQFEY